MLLELTTHIIYKGYLRCFYHVPPIINFSPWLCKL